MDNTGANAGMALVGCCNKDGGLYQVDMSFGVEQRFLEGVDVRAICPFGDGVLVATKTTIYRVGPDMDLSEVCGAAAFQEPGEPSLAPSMHGLDVYNDRIYVVVAGYQRIAVCDRDMKVLGWVRLADDPARRLQPNSVRALPQGLAVSMLSLFGNDWPPRKSGCVVLLPWEAVEQAVSTGRTVDFVVRGKLLSWEVDQPHSLLPVDGGLLCCESMQSKLWMLSLDGGDPVMVKDFGSGYLRGLAMAGDILLVGESAELNHPKLKHQIRCRAPWARVWKLRWPSLAVVGVHHLPESTEVYYIQPMPDGMRPVPGVSGGVEAVNARAWLSGEAVVQDIGKGEALGHREHIGLLYTLASYLDRPTILEIGVEWGRSTRVLLKAAMERGGRMFSCDSDPTTRASVPEPLWPHWTFFPMSSVELAKTWDAPIDLLFIDGDHSYEGVKADFESFSRHVKPGGILVLHDTGSNKVGVRRFLKEIPDSGWDQIGYLDFGAGVAVLKKRKA